jgi:hypothetical protein
MVPDRAWSGRKDRDGAESPASGPEHRGRQVSVPGAVWASIIVALLEHQHGANSCQGCDDRVFRFPSAFLGIRARCSGRAGNPAHGDMLA